MLATGDFEKLGGDVYVAGLIGDPLSSKRAAIVLVVAIASETITLVTSMTDLYQLISKTWIE